MLLSLYPYTKGGGASKFTNSCQLSAAQLLSITTVWVSDVTDFSVTNCHQLHRQVGDRICGILYPLTIPLPLQSLSPPAPESATPVISPNRFYRRGSSSNGERRQRVAYSDQEVQTLLEAVKRQGRAWTSILSQNSFHPSRNATDLKDKYKQLMVRLSPYVGPK